MSSQTGAKTALDEVSAKGEFKRTDAGFRNAIEPGGRFPPEAGRYHLYISLACPWACRCLAVLYLKGLDHAIGLSVTHPTWARTRPDKPGDAHNGWQFANPDDPPVTSPSGYGSFGCAGCIPDPVNHVKYIRDLYEMAHDTTGKYSVPVLWDKVEKTIVCNESSEIIRMFNHKFNDIAKNPSLDLYPPALRSEIDAVNEWVYPTINNGVYRCGFATTQEAYELAFKDLFASLDRCEQILGKQRYIAGDVLTEADVRLYMTLIRFDPVYVVYFKTNKRPLEFFPNIREYTKDLYQTPGLRASTNIDHIKTHYFTSHPTLNHYAIIPVGPDPWWELPHDREKFSKL